MADANEIQELRRLIDELDNTTYTDEVLSVRLDEASSTRSLASSIWREKAATLAGLVDVQEGNSSRKMGSLYKQALEMATSLSTDDSGAVITRRVSRTRKIERQ